MASPRASSARGNDMAWAAEFWSERRDLNSGPPVPQTGALTGLRYAPTDAGTINSMAVGRNTLRDMPMKSRVLVAMWNGPPNADGLFGPLIS